MMQEQQHPRSRGTRGTSEDVYVSSGVSRAQHGSRALLRRRLGAGKRSRPIAGVLLALLFLLCLLAYRLRSGTSAEDLSAHGNAINELGRPNSARVTEPSPTATDPAVLTSAEAPFLSPTPTDTPARSQVTPTTTNTISAPPAPSPATEYINILDSQDRRTARPEPVFEDVARQYEEGEYVPEEPHLLPGLQIQRRTFTPAELLERFGDADIIYSFVNGSEANHQYRKAMRMWCLSKLRSLENTTYWEGGRLPAALQSMMASNTPTCLPPYLKNAYVNIHSTHDLVATVMGHARPGLDDRETDELRHSLRSVEQHVQWHRGRVVMVSPGHHPTWVDGAKNFLAGVCGGARVQALRSRGTHLRVTTVHQDAVMPYGMRLTVDSHVIEQHLWRVRNVTAVHVYMNDDYFVNRDVAITDLFNEYGGTIVRTERGILRKGVLGPPSDGTWSEGVRNTHLFNIMELDLHHEDYLPEALERQWSAERVQRGASGVGDPVPPIALNDMVDAAYAHVPAPLPPTALPRRHRRYATHAPFVYCTNMHRFLQTRYAAELAYNSLHHRSRSARDLFVPFLYNAFIMARPWQASPRFLPYLLELHRSRRQARTDAMPPTQIVLDNVDGCGPASLRGGFMASECVFAKFVDNTTLNEAVVERVRQVNPLYFNINAGFSSARAADQLRGFLHGKFPTPVYLEVGDAPPPGEGGVDGAGAAAGGVDAALRRLFGDLMALPVVGVVSYEEGVCPLVRSLALAFAGHHRGGVRVSVERHGGATLREARAALGHRVVSAMPAPACAYTEQVSVDSAGRGESVAEIARRAMGEMRGGVELPSTCGGGGAGLRVRGFVVDARTRGAPVRSAAALRDALAVPAQTLSLEDFRAVAVGPSAADVVLVVSREDAEAKAVHWVNGASESDLLVTYPLPVEAYEDMAAEVRWSVA
ncbi:conserved hypothetical protein [Leishmania mexicana MHOM/GT/2001/U1103]|uniref:Stealth protein CR3 conserved region 3 domain-containing protein n=1 Tax=Leishmania mexicana (strain MHOM/GT/2001/U1103) TaxID=929439 RepID=E9AQR1_LEIMU|nr:conserved hypothetical protein [Leishmania mexicana MHOM/GT/2001/U1103]CBZ25282.1 conserved hypothetical protein [Leishmania mexicana MHOM/GT/2001/U1103]